MFKLFAEVQPIIKDIDIFKDFQTLGLKILLPLVIAFIVAGYVGLERQNVGKAAGISAHILVGLAATGIAIFNRLIFDWQIELAIQGHDVRPEGQRVIAQVLAGVGFIGAGVILKDKFNVIRGLTTASTIWSVAIIGVILGSGYILLGSLLGIIIMIFITIRDISRGVNPFIHIDEQKRDHMGEIQVKNYHD
ncbi:MgtC/SapB family protein [Haploplasma axanthum]|uniref:Putative Mg(2+) transport ATPase n=1 Tax=Haploplasma axanthum TaxID=29552 RepID=A0A449BC84_HAPAX|nr:MgtC/SapB family protein [Haploplasma axanthum]VEU80059.1 putative Mg(2+) transport ATPase [Haploplasma axanthum]